MTIEEKVDIRSCLSWLFQRPAECDDVRKICDSTVLATLSNLSLLAFSIAVFGQMCLNYINNVFLLRLRIVRSL